MIYVVLGVFLFLLAVANFLLYRMNKKNSAPRWLQSVSLFSSCFCIGGGVAEFVLAIVKT